MPPTRGRYRSTTRQASYFLPEVFNDPTRQLLIEMKFEDLKWADGKRIGLSDIQCGMLTRTGKKSDVAPGCVTRSDSPCRLVPETVRSRMWSEEEARQRFDLFLANKYEVRG